MQDKISEFKRKAHEIHGNKYDYSYVSSIKYREKVPIICPEHGEFMQYHYAHLRGQNCPRCARAKVTGTTQAFIEKAKKVHEIKYDYSKVTYGKTSYEKVCIVCPKHGEFTQSPSDHLMGKGCKKCGIQKMKSANRRTWNDYLSDVNAKFNGKFSYPNLETEFKNGNSLITIECPNHGTITLKARTHLKSNYGCGKCGNEKTGKNSRLDAISILERFCSQHGNVYDYSSSDLTDYKNIRDTITVNCKEHGVFHPTIFSHIKGGGFCPQCSRHSSSAERDIVTFIKTLYSGEIKLHSRNVLDNGKELDIFIPGKNLAIEYNGMYWHSFLKKPKAYHQDKSLECRELGIRLIHIFEMDWIKNNTKIKDTLRSILDDSNQRIYARSTNIIELDVKTASAFCSSYHRQSYAPSSVRLGLKDKSGDLITVATFGKPRFNRNKYKWELIRFCTKSGIQVIGGMGKLLKHFKSNYTKCGDKIVSFASLNYGYGDVYKLLGFTEKSVSAPNYVWYKNFTTLSRYQCQKHKLKEVIGSDFDHVKSETENMQDAGYLRVYDAGNIVYELTV